MIHVITAANRHLYERQLLQMHRQRTEVFVKGMGWNRPVAPDGGEYDEGDDDQAIYFLALDDNGDVEVGLRARRTTDWSVIGDVFPHFVNPAEPSVRNPDVWEMARLYAVGAMRGPEGFNRRGEVRLAIIEKAVQCGIRRVVGMSEVYLLGPALRSGWRLKVIGLPQSYGEGDAVAVEVEASPEAVVELRERLALDRSACLELPADGVLADLSVKEAEVFVDALRKLPEESRESVLPLLKRVLDIQGGQGAAAAESAIRDVLAALDAVVQPYEHVARLDA